MLVNEMRPRVRMRQRDSKGAVTPGCLDRTLLSQPRKVAVDRIDQLWFVMLLRLVQFLKALAPIFVMLLGRLMLVSVVLA